MASNVIVFPLATVLPSLIHFISGVGFPVALQWNVAVADSSTIWSAGVVIKLGATERINFQVETEAGDKLLFQPEA